MHYETLTDLLQQNRTTSRSIHYLNGENETSTVPFADLYTRAGQRLGELQRLGATSGDKVILFLNDNEQFIDGFWGAIAGGIVPVPLAVGIADAHRQKLLTIAKLLNNPFLYTDRKNLDRLGAYAATAGELYESLRRAHGFSLPQSRLRAAVNDAFVPWTQPLADGDCVVFIPPVSGG